LLRWFSPILSFTTEEIYQLVERKNKSIHLEKFLDLPKSFKNDVIYKKWLELIKIRDICNISIEEKRANKEIGSSLEADLDIKLNNKFKQIVENVDFSELCITSKAEIDFDEKGEVSVTTKKALGKKCKVCWKIKLDPCERHPKCQII
jgi:isoleucyl-tRNA synthetase